jgi:eukaryotic-like serine/threonine-protein kinase
MGAVYLGLHQIIGKKVAVKFLHRDLAQSQEVVARFYREAQAAAEIGHRSIIDVMDVGVSPDGEPFIVMEYLEGESLASLLERQGPLDLGAACGIMESVLLGLAVAHEKGIVHRDLKPDNIFLNARVGEPPAVKLIDFGISKITREGTSSKLTQTGSLLGTPAYMSPEQARGESEVDHRTDLYSIGVVLYEMLTGKLPFEGENYNQLIVKVLTRQPTPPRQANPAFPREAEELVLRALAKNREERFQSALEMLEALKNVSAFEARHDRLTLAASGLKKKSLATGDLGESAERGFTSSSGSGNKSGLGLGEVNGTPKVWSLSGRVERSSKTVKYAVIGLGGAVALAAVLAVVLKGFPGSEAPSSKPGSSTGSKVAPAAPIAAPRGETVTITILDAPAKAKVFFDGALVSDNPFSTRKETTSLPLRVEAEGYESYQTQVSPDRDQTIKVALNPIPTGKSGDDVRPGSGAATSLSVSKHRDARPRSVPEGKKSERPASAQSPAEAPVRVEAGSRKKIQKGGRDTSRAEEFE